MGADDEIDSRDLSRSPTHRHHDVVTEKYVGIYAWSGKVTVIAR